MIGPREAQQFLVDSATAGATPGATEEQKNRAVLAIGFMLLQSQVATLLELITSPTTRGQGGGRIMVP